MVVQNRPTNDLGNIQLLHAWRPAGSQTLLWAKDMSTGRLLHLMQWGDQLYLPVTEGLRLGICIFNGSGNWMAFPTYIEGKNLFDNGPSRPDDCTIEDMWEVEPGGSHVMDALKGRDRRTGRPLIIVPNGQGMGVGEATYGTDAYRGQIRIYERRAENLAASYKQPMRPSFYPSGPTTRDADPHIFGSGETTRGGATKGGGAVPRGVPQIGTNHQVGIGAGAEELRPSHATGVQYGHGSLLVAALRVESRADLAEVLRAARHVGAEWYWTPSGPRWFTTWTPPVNPVSPHIPVAHPAPHSSYSTNQGGGTW